MRIRFFIFSMLTVLLCICCDPLTNKYFSRLFSIDEDKIEVGRICENNPSAISDGDFVEIYDLSKETLDIFENKFGKKTELNFPERDDYEPVSKYDHIIPWTKATTNQNTTELIMSSIDFVKTDLKCFEINDLKRIVTTKGNYYTFFYNSYGHDVYSFHLLALDSESSRLYVLKILAL